MHRKNSIPELWLLVVRRNRNCVSNQPLFSAKQNTSRKNPTRFFMPSKQSIALEGVPAGPRPVLISVRRYRIAVLTSNIQVLPTDIPRVIWCLSISR